MRDADYHTKASGAKTLFALGLLAFGSWLAWKALARAQKRRSRSSDDDRLDHALEESFPASDPVSVTIT